ncbi:SLAM family member 6 [Saccopteryx bilineata]|uniref:SLAM family member 6 n=1 Tax=Saccopteryx bilineata TaxID=59482 RepID=UPI00338DD4AD
MNLAAVKSPAPVSSAKSMTWLFPFVTLVFCLGPGNTVSQTREIVLQAVLGESVTLPLNFPERKDIQSITWLHNGTSIIFIQSEGKQSQITDPKRKDRLHVIQPYSLQINNLTIADEGRYGAQITTADSTEISYYNLEIFRRLRNLQVANHTQLSENGTCEVHLTCSVENPNDHVSFRWQVIGNTPLQEANLTISWNPKNSSEQTYICIAENPVSNLSFSLSVPSLCKGVFNEKNQHLDIKWIIIPLALICISVVIFAWKKKATGSFWFSNQQTQNSAETMRNSEYDPISPGNTHYSQTCHCNQKMETPLPMKNNDSSTIYSTIYQSKQGNSP